MQILIDLILAMLLIVPPIIVINALSIREKTLKEETETTP